MFPFMGGTIGTSPLQLGGVSHNWHFEISVQDVAGEVCMSDNRMALSECSKVGSQFNTLPAPSVSCVDVLANRVLGS